MSILIKNLFLIRNGICLLENINLCFLKGTTNIILGKSGSGKSCLIKSIVNLMQYEKGSIIYNNKIITSKELLNIGFVFQGNALFDDFSVKENIVFGLDTYCNSSLLKTIDSVGISKDNLIKYPNELSGGMQKRVAIARSLIRNNNILILDEPTTGLDISTANLIGKTINNIRSNDKNKIIICVTHDLELAKNIGDNFILLEDKKIKWQGNKIDIHIPEFINYFNKF